MHRLPRILGCVAFALSLLIALPGAASAATWTDLGSGKPGVAGTPQLAGGGCLGDACLVSFELAGAAPNSLAILIAGTSAVNLPFYGGTLVPSPEILVTLATDANGGIAFSFPFPAGVAPGTGVFVQYWIADAAATRGASASNAISGTTAPPPQSGAMPAAWINGGPNCGAEPSIQVHAFNEDLYILRQSLCTDFEAPFLYLLFGEDRAILFDTGAGGIALYTTVNGLVQSWAAAHGKATLPLVVAHLHPHGDHTAGDSQFAGKPNVTLVGTSQTAVKNFFGITLWPTQIVEYDLGERVLDVVPIPGHHDAHIAVYDRRTATLLTGDSLYSGRLYVFGALAQGNWTKYKASLQRLVDFTADRPLAWVLGTHVEMSNVPGVDFPIGSTSHPNEHPLQLERRHLLELHEAAHAMGSSPFIQVHDDFIIYPSG